MEPSIKQSSWLFKKKQKESKQAKQRALEDFWVIIYEFRHPDSRTFQGSRRNHDEQKVPEGQRQANAALIS